MELSPSWEANNCSTPQDNPNFYRARRFISVFTRALHWFLFWARLIQSTLSSYLSYLYANIHVLFQVIMSVIAFRVQEKHGDINYVVRFEVLTAVAMKRYNKVQSDSSNKHIVCIYACCFLHAGSLFVLLCDTEDGDHTFRRNVH
jgi:hypothetical protein